MRSSLRSLKRLLGHRNPLRLGWHHAKSFGAALRYGFPARRLVVIGITGTDGKTTTVGMTAHILHERGFKAGALSTAFFRINDQVTWNETQKTSPSPFVIQSFLRRLVDAGCTHAVLECSSHGLVQGRTAWTWPGVAAITNISPEHLDYHGTMEQYRSDKGILFLMLRGRGTKVLNRDDSAYGHYRRIASSHTTSFGHTESREDDMNLWTTALHVTTQATTATLHARRGEKITAGPLRLSIAGEFNVDNALCAIGCASAVGIDPLDAAAALATFPGVPGRIERIDEGQPFAVFVDFTVTPASYERTLSTMKAMLPRGKRLLVLTGSCGDRMREKRPQVGKICSELADIVIVTNEDPYTEDPQTIIDEVWAGVDQSKTEARKIVDRREAIAFLFQHAKPGDAVILCGKGSDTMMMLKDGQVPWNEREIAREMLRGLRGKR